MSNTMAMNVRIQTLQDGSLLGLWQITETASELRSQLQFPDMYADRIARLPEDSLRMREILAVRCLLKAMTGEEQRVQYDEEGSPLVPQQMESVRREKGREIHEVWSHLSISHTDGWAVVILSCHPVGIDIERLGRRVQRVTSHFLKAPEMEILQDDVELHIAWCVKESLFKILGRDYYDLRRRTSVRKVSYTSRKENVRRGTVEVAVEEQGLKTLQFETNDDFVLTYIF